MGERPTGMTLDRIDNDGNYTPNNCKWSTRKEQAGNKRELKNSIWLTYKGKTMVLMDWARELGISYATLQTRYHRNFKTEEIFSPIHRQTGGKLQCPKE